MRDDLKPRLPPGVTLDAVRELEQAVRAFAEADQRKCDGDKACSKPKVNFTRSGATYADLRCENCGGTWRATWD